MAQMGPRVFVPTKQDLADILGRTDLNSENSYFWDLLDPKFPDFQVPDFQISRNLAWAGLGPGWAGLGPWAGCAPWVGQGDEYPVKNKGSESKIKNCPPESK